MTMWPIAVITGAIVGLGVLLVVRELMPAKPQLKAALDRLSGDDKPAPLSLLKGEEIGMTQKAGAWTARNLPSLSAAKFGPSDADLDLIGKSRTTHLGEKALAAVAGLVIIPLLGLFASVVGLPVSVAPPVAGGLAIGIALFFAPDLDAKTKAKKARQDFTRAVSVYLELLAIERTSGAGASQSAIGAAQVAHSWPFQRITETLQKAQWDGKAAWTALHDLGVEIDVPALLDVADILAQAGTQGAAVHEQLQGRAKALRESQLAVEEEIQHQNSVRMYAMVPLTAIVYFLMLIFPMGVTMFTS
jgi:hypothetical protein